MKQIEVHSLEETKALGLTVSKLIKPGMLLTLSGDLGAGKTTFTKYLGKGLGVEKTINSPTFTILKIYKGRMPVYHMDAYRLEGIAQDLGFEDYYESDGLCIVEWPNFIEYQLPKERLEIIITRIEDEADGQRLFSFHPIGKLYEAIVEEL